MECNKDEALRAKQIAENRMQSGDFVGALKFARKAQRLFPEIQNITQILTVCEVHCAAQNKLSTSDMDWYGILLTDKFTEEATIKKQYKKLALLLHPDKNRSAGAEAAFKLIVEANRVLSDPTKRSLYNAKISRLVGITASQVPSHHTDRSYFGVKVDENARNYHNSFHSHTHNSNQQDERPTFWTSCQHCNTKYQYYRSIVNATVHCQQCSRPFKAHDIGFYVPTEHTPQSFNSHKYPPNHVPPKEASKSNGRKPYGKGPEEKVVPSCPVYMAKCSAGNGASCKVRKSKDGHGAAGVTKAGAGTSNGATSKAKQSQIPTNVGSKRARQPASAEFESASKRPQQDKSFKSVKVEKQEVPGNGGFNNTNPASFTADVVDQNGEIRNKANAQPEKTDLRKQMKSNIDDTKAKAENSQLKSNLPPDDVISCPDPDFSNFDKIKTEDSFADNQFWAIYDDTDCMPRFYAHIKKVHSPFKLEYTWLEPNPNHKDEIDWYDAGLPVACGKYRLGHSQKTRDCGMFSHQVHCTKGSARGSYLVYPMKGETWAIFRHWDIGWSSNPEKNSEYQFEYVEVLSDFDEKDGVKVAYLRKVKGFVSLFQQTVQNGIGIFCIPSKELYRFSHRVPSFTMTGNEREDVPRGSFELDPAGLPMSVTRVEVGDPSDVKMKVEKLNNVVSSCQESSKRKVEQAKSNERVHKAKLRKVLINTIISSIIQTSTTNNMTTLSNYFYSLSQTPHRLRKRMLATWTPDQEFNQVRQRSGADMKRKLNWYDLVALGVGGMLGVGVFVTTGPVALHQSGPSVFISYIIAGISALLSSLCYTEFAVQVPVAGGAFSYLRLTFGEFLGYFGGANILMEYVFSNAAVARSFTEYLSFAFGENNPNVWRVEVHGLPKDYNMLDFPAVALILLLTLCLCHSTKESSILNLIMTIFHVIFFGFIIVAGYCNGSPKNLVNPKGIAPYGVRGVLDGAAIVYFSYIGYDSASTMAEEVKDPYKSLPIGIVGSVLITTLLYCLMALSLCIMVPYNKISEKASYSMAFLNIGWSWASNIVGAGASLGIVASLLVAMLGQARYLCVIGRARLVPSWLAKVHPSTGTPLNATIFLGFCTASIALFTELDIIIELISIGTLMVFYMVANALIYRRYVITGRTPPLHTLLFLFLLSITSLCFSIVWKFKQQWWGLVLFGGFMITIIVFFQHMVPCDINLVQQQYGHCWYVPFMPWPPSMSIFLNVFLMTTLKTLSFQRFAIWSCFITMFYVLYGVHSTYQAEETENLDGVNQVVMNLSVPNLQTKVEIQVH